MKKLFSVLLLAAVMLLLVAPIAFGADAATAASPDAGKLSYYAMAVLGCAIGIGLAALGTGIGQGFGVRGACEGVARNPGASGKITTTLIIGLAMIESLAIYALVVVLIVFFVNPFKI
ncbi:MAG: ATP synthase F0 subunit C [Nitrospiraceae bacterium]|nr:ATP synthase F0 subunit C [Nitrospiraceae bacterium]MDA8325113.1 ATP synthase F0 subunit C [Nitrospiraceae bacterium]